jgi:hypothetical protein
MAAWSRRKIAVVAAEEKRCQDPSTGIVLSSLGNWLLRAMSRVTNVTSVNNYI